MSFTKGSVPFVTPALSLALAVALALALAVVPAADAGKHRKRLRGHVLHAQAKAPKRWSQRPAPSPTQAPTATPAPTATATPGSSLPAPNPRSLSVASVEYAFTLSQRTVSAGDVRVELDNSRAEDPHQLAIDGPDPDYWSFAEQPAGSVTRRTITMRPGTYVLFCPILDHEARGMRATLTVQ